MPEGDGLPDPSDPKIPVLTPAELEKADEYGEMLTAKLPLVNALDLADSIDDKLREHLEYLMNREEKTVEQLKPISAQLGWWCVLLITKLRAVVLEDLQRRGKLIVPPGDHPSGGEPS